ncbi:Uncharacterized protein Fot_37627 [Forsythia ovata]|uniref:Uncharacterized protein n=1 Tax=Forsythia ovata TaxID=205694 RepID=A0ABD1RZJ3_9LAMI
MLALSETNNAGKPEEESITIEDPKDSNPLFINDQKKVKIKNSSPTNLLRLKYVPASSTEFNRRLDVKNSDLDESKSVVRKQATKVQNVKSSLNGKVSSLFSSRNKNLVMIYLAHVNPKMNLTLWDCLMDKLAMTELNVSVTKSRSFIYLGFWNYPETKLSFFSKFQEAFPYQQHYTRNAICWNQCFTYRPVQDKFRTDFAQQSPRLISKDDKLMS